MANWRIVRLNFKGCPIHFGQVGIGLESSSDRARSDTLFGAWIHAYAKLFGSEEVEALLRDAFAAPDGKRKPSIRMSSTFPYRYKNPTYEDYLPKPLVFPPGDRMVGDAGQFKTYKKLAYLPLEIWQKWYQKQEFEQGDLEKIALGKEERDVLWKTDIVPRVSLDRATQASNFYHAGFTWYRYNSEEDEDYAGLYFLMALEGGMSQYEQNLQAALHFLGEEGLGGERSSGAGRFEVAYWGDLDRSWQQLVKGPSSHSSDSPHYCLLSLWWQQPMPENWCDETTRYKLLERGGWVGSPFSGRQVLRKKVRMFEEGSVFRMRPVGQLADVTPQEFHQHRVYRNGIALSLPVRVSKEKSRGK